MTCDYVLSHFDAMALWDAVLDTNPEEMTVDPLIEDPFEREMAAIEALLDEAEAALPIQTDE